MSVEQVPNPDTSDEPTKDELVALVRDLQEEVSDVRSENEDLRQEVQDLRAWRQGVSNWKDNVNERLDKIEAGEIEASQLSESVRHELLPIHRMFIDVKNNEAELSASKRRAARLFGRFLAKKTQDKVYDVDKTNGSLKLTASKAREVLEGANDIPESGKSTIVKRAMKEVQSLSKEESCDCGGLGSCTHGLIRWDKRKSENVLLSEDEAFTAYLQSIEAAVEGTVQPADDAEGGNSVEDSHDVDDQPNTAVSQDDPFDELAGASAVTNDTEDTIETDIETQPTGRGGGL